MQSVWYSCSAASLAQLLLFPVNNEQTIAFRWQYVLHSEYFWTLSGHRYYSKTTLTILLFYFLAGVYVSWHLGTLHWGMCLKKPLHYEAAKFKHMAHCASFSCQHEVRCLIKTYAEQNTTNVSLLLGLLVIMRFKKQP